MKKDSLNEIFWNNRYLDRKTGWDLGIISPPIKKWFETQKNKDLKILVPGAGKGHEVKYGFKNGFKNIHYLDLSTEAILSFKKNCPNFPKEKISWLFLINLISLSEPISEIPPEYANALVIELNGFTR